jgi:hypothetical protein
VADSCEDGNEPSGSIKKAGYTLHKLSNCQLFKEYPAHFYDMVFGLKSWYHLVPTAAWSKAHMVFNHLNSGIVGLNPDRGMDFCGVLPFVGSGLAMADPPSKGSYQMSRNRFISFRSQILNWNRPESLIRIYIKAGTITLQIMYYCRAVHTV